MAATAGAGFSSGRELVMFFAQMGHASWVGVVFASVMFGMLCGMICRFAQSTGSRSFSGVCMRVLGIRQGSVAGAVHGLLMAVTAGVMIVAASEMTALALPVRNAFWIGALFSTGLALLLSMRGMRGMARLGAAAVVLCGVFYVSLALDVRPVRIYQRYETVPELDGSVTAALTLSMLHACMNASVAGGAVTVLAERAGSPSRFAFSCGSLMLMLLSAGNAALQRGGERLFSQALPTVVLAARWGVFGYYASVLVMWLCAVTTLSAALGSLAGYMDDDRRSRRLLAAVLLLGALTAMLSGAERFVEIGYPMLGWAAAFSMAGLACCFDWRTYSARGRNMLKMRVKL